jgi:nicotinate-nucleotide--dimethylbenzimidazole phosphoribosyltransferase
LSTGLDQVLARIEHADQQARAEAARALDAKTKPRGSLGRLEELAQQLAGIRHTASPGRLRAVVVVAAGDHGVAVEGVSAYPQEVTRQMLANFDAGGAAVSVLARNVGAEVRVVDAGVGAPTANIATGHAMTRDQARRHIEQGISLADELAREDFAVVALGEMGIGNSTVAAALTAALLGAKPEQVCGRGTGVDDAGLEHKATVVARALAVNDVTPEDPLGALAALGGFELAVLCGVALGAAANRQAVVLDGFISSAAALVATRIAPRAVDAMIAAHLSPEPGHGLVLEALRLEPLLILELRLGEGSGAALALPLLDASLAILGEMATFDEAGVTDAGR